jgi:glycosyltransferase involved in cell wall biosynthesis
MNLIINTSNLYVGGGVQVAISFINELKFIEEKNIYHIFLSKEIEKQLNKKSFPKNFKFYLIEESPSSLKNRRKIVKKLNDLEIKINPDAVFSIFAPTYWRPKSKHVAGFALGWITNPKSLAFQTLSFKEKIKRKLDSYYKTYYIKRDIDYYVVETEDVKEKLIKILNINENRIFVVSNTYSSVYDKNNYDKLLLPDKKNNEFRLITIAHNYPHKNIKIIKDVLPFLENEQVKYKFYITIDNESYEKIFKGLEDKVINLGSVETKYCPSLYEQCDALFLPTLLESFSASYPEAMKMKKPILTSNLSFAHSICKDAALYFDPLDPKDIAQKIIKLSQNRNLQEDLINKGLNQLQNFETAKSRAIKYLKICKQIIKDKK